MKNPVVSLAVEHFGELRRAGKYGHRMTRELYAVPNKKPTDVFPRDMFTDQQWTASDWVYEDAEHTIHSDEFCEHWHTVALENYDLNLAYFSSIPAESFEAALTDLQTRSKLLKPVTDLRTLKGAEGVYVMVLDDYKQAYIGQARDIRARIMRHWSGVKQFDRLIFGSKYESVLSIDSFRSLDTTRIFAARTSMADSLEIRLVKSFPGDLLLNRMGGGKPMKFRGLFIEQEMKRRQLIMEDSGSQGR